MRCRSAWLPLALLVAGAEAALGQATAVQLPTYSFFSTNSTVVVPDRGSVYLGGIKRAASGRSEFGVPLLPLRNRAFGLERSASGASVSVFIHDFDAMDEYLLSRPTPSLPNGYRPAAAATVRGRAEATGVAAKVEAVSPAASVAALRARHERQTEARFAEAEEFLRRGREAEAAGKGNVARIYYEMAARRAAGPLRSEVLARLDLLDKADAPAKLAQSTR